MSAIIQNDPEGKIQNAIDSIVKRSVELQLGLLAPCLLTGHEADRDVDFKRTRQVGKGIVQIEYAASRLVPHPDLPKSLQDKTAVDLKLCARCGVVYEEKSK